MSIESDTSNPCAPAERNVYSKSGSLLFSLFLLFEAPAGRYVYRIPAPQILKPQRGDMWEAWLRQQNRRCLRITQEPEANYEQENSI